MRNFIYAGLVFLLGVSSLSSVGVWADDRPTKSDCIQKLTYVGEEEFWVENFISYLFQEFRHQRYFRYAGQRSSETTDDIDTLYILFGEKDDCQNKKEILHAAVKKFEFGDKDLPVIFSDEVIAPGPETIDYPLEEWPDGYWRKDVGDILEEKELRLVSADWVLSLRYSEARSLHVMPSSHGPDEFLRFELSEKQQEDTAVYFNGEKDFKSAVVFEGRWTRTLNVPAPITSDTLLFTLPEERKKPEPNVLSGGQLFHFVPKDEVSLGSVDWFDGVRFSKFSLPRPTDMSSSFCDLPHVFLFHGEALIADKLTCEDAHLHFEKQAIY